MKNIKSRILLSILIILLSCISSGCFFPGSTGIVGSWTLVEITNNGVTKTAAELGYTYGFTFDENGNFSRTTDGVISGEGTYTYNTSNGYLALVPAAAYASDMTLGSGTSSVDDNDVFDRGYFDTVTDSNVAEIYSRVD